MQKKELNLYKNSFAKLESFVFKYRKQPTVSSELIKVSEKQKLQIVCVNEKLVTILIQEDAYRIHNRL